MAPDQVGGLVHHDHRRRAEPALHVAQAVEIHQHRVADVLRDQRDRNGDDALHAYLERAPRVWVEVGWTHPLVGQVQAPAGQMLLLRPPHEWTAIADAPFRDIYEILEFQLPGDRVTWADVPIAEKLTVPLRLARGTATEPAEMWVLRGDAVEQIDALVRDADDRSLARLAFAVAGVSTRQVPASGWPCCGCGRARATRRWWCSKMLFTAGLTCDCRTCTCPSAHGCGRRSGAMPSAGCSPRTPTASSGSCPRATIRSFRSHCRNRRSGRWPIGSSTCWTAMRRRSLRGSRRRGSSSARSSARMYLRPKRGKHGCRSGSRAGQRPPSRKRPKPKIAAAKAKPTPSPIAPLEDTFATRPAATPSEVQVRLKETEAQFLAVDGPLDDPRRLALWPELARLNGLLGQKADAGLAWANALWEPHDPPPTWAWGWVEAEQALPKPELTAADLDRLLAQRSARRHGPATAGRGDRLGSSAAAGAAGIDPAVIRRAAVSGDARPSAAGAGRLVGVARAGDSPVPTC